MDASSFQEEEGIINNQTAKPVVEELLASGTKSPVNGAEMETDHGGLNSEMEADHGGLNSNYMNTDMLFASNGGSTKGKKGKKEFIIANDEDEGQWEVVNGEISKYRNM